MATIQSGTRTRNNLQLSVNSTRNFTRPYTRDAGMTKLATGALVFDVFAGTVTLAGQLGAFAYNDDVLIGGTALNNGLFQVTSTGVNALALIPFVVTETAPATATIRNA